MRIFYNNTEITKQIDRLDTINYALTYTTGNYIYIASDFPFNQLYIKLGAVVNAISTSMTVEYLADGWTSVAELRDETSALSTSGNIEFTPNRNSSWKRTTDSSEAGLTTVVYYKYWTRISFASDLTAAVLLSFMGNKFSDDSDLFDEYPVFDDAAFLSAFKTSKTTWEEQHIKAAVQIVADLQRKNIIVAPEQILERKRFIGASVCKCAEIIFTSFGNDYIEQRKAAKEEYSKRLDLSQYSIDKNNNAILEIKEKTAKQGWLYR